MCELHHIYKAENAEKCFHKKCKCASDNENHEKCPNCKCMTSAEHKAEHTCNCKKK